MFSIKRFSTDRALRYQSDKRSFIIREPICLYFLHSQWAKSPKKQSVGVLYFDNTELYFECRFNKNVLLETVFLAILPTGLSL